MKIDPNRVEKVLVIGLSCMGDMFLASSALWNLREFLPRARFTLWVGPRALSAVEGDPFWDEIEPYDRSGEFAGFAGRIRAIRKMRKVGYDLIIDLRSSLLPLVSGCRYAPLWGWHELWLSKNLHEAERNLLIVSSLGVPLKTRCLRYHIPEEEAGFFQRTVAERLEEKRLVIFNPGGATPTKSWPVDSFSELGRRLLASGAFKVGVLGYSPREADIARAILSDLKEGGLDLSGPLRLGKVASCLKQADLMVSNDSGLLHLASAVGTPTVGIFPPGNVNRYGPWQTRHRIVAPKPCKARCHEIRCNDRRCLGTLPVSIVEEACRSLLFE